MTCRWRRWRRCSRRVDGALAGEADFSLAAEAIALAPGESGAIEVRIRNQAASGIHGEAQLISPFGSWLQTRPWTAGFAVGADAASTVRFEVDIPPTARPGEQWWAIVKVMYFGRIRYSRAVEVTGDSAAGQITLPGGKRRARLGETLVTT